MLVLGTLPGPLTLETKMYYAAPTNSFWSIMNAVVGLNPDAPYGERICALVRNKIALWDVLSSASRYGALDRNIQDPEPNQLTALLLGVQSIRRVCFNGGKAARLFDRYIRPSIGQELSGLEFVILPSSSAAYAGIAFEEKVKRWRKGILI